MKNSIIKFLILLFVVISCEKEGNSDGPDKIMNTLYTSRVLYENANIGDWIEISKSEYEALATKLKNVTRSGVSEAEFNHPEATVAGDNIDFTFVQNDGYTLPVGSYLFAFRLSVAEGTNTGFKVKLSSTAPNDGFSDVGSDLPTHKSGERFFVLKGNTNPTSGVGYLGFFKPNNVKINYKKNIPGIGNFYFMGFFDTNAPKNTPIFLDDYIVYLHQGLSTTSLQW